VTVVQHKVVIFHHNETLIPFFFNFTPTHLEDHLSEQQNRNITKCLMCHESVQLWSVSEYHCVRTCICTVVCEFTHVIIHARMSTHTLEVVEG
jgi:hypothetical protein